MSENPRQPNADLKFTRLWIEAQHTLTGFVTLHVHDYAAVDDIIQEVATQATENFDQYDPARPFGAWLIGIARMRIAESYRKKGRSPVVFSDDVISSISDAFIAAQPETNERLEALRGCMAKLSDRHRRVIELRYARQRSSDEIADQVGGSSEAVDSMLYRIRLALRDCIAKRMEGQR
ncbi:MAG: sigma-70 family RNA polymerase sigma factor [Planctomycetota bacterium]